MDFPANGSEGLGDTDGPSGIDPDSGLAGIYRACFLRGNLVLSIMHAAASPTEAEDRRLAEGLEWWQWAVEFYKEMWEDEMKDQAGVGVGLPLSPTRPPTTIATSPTTGDSAKTSWTTEESVESLEMISSRRGPTRRQRSPKGSNEERRPRTSESGQWQKVPEPKRMGGAILQKMNEAASPWKKK